MDFRADASTEPAEASARATGVGVTRWKRGTMIITCKRRPLIIRGEESYEVRAAGRLLSDNVRDPLTDGARILLAEGVDPAEPLVLRQRAPRWTA